MSRDLTPFGLRMPTELKSQIDAAAAANGRSINAEIIGRLRASLNHSTTSLSAIPDGMLLDEVIVRYGARQVTIVVDAEPAEVAPPSTRTKPR